MATQPHRAPHQPPPTDVDWRSFDDLAHTTTHQAFHRPFDVTPRKAAAPAAARPHLPWLAADPTTAAAHAWKDPPLLKLLADSDHSGASGQGRPAFDAESEYIGEYGPKNAHMQLPHLAGTLDSDGQPLPGPRKSLGVQFWHRGEPDHLYCMLPYHVPAPCWARQVFTTVHDDEETVRFIVCSHVSWIPRCYPLAIIEKDYSKRLQGWHRNAALMQKRALKLYSAHRQVEGRPWRPHQGCHIVCNSVCVQGAIVIHYGEGRRTGKTQVLGQLDLNGIPPAPRDVPRIEVKFILDASNRLTVEVRDLDTQRHKKWLQRGSVTLVSEGDADLAPGWKEISARLAAA